MASLAAAKADIDRQDRVARKEHLGVLVAAGRAVLAEVAGSTDPSVAEVAELLAQVIDQDTEEDDDGNPQIRRGAARDRVVSHSDPEMRHGRKSASRRFDGFKMDVVADEASELVLGVPVRAANAGDGEGATPPLEAIPDTLAELAPQVEKGIVLADMAYSDGDVRVAVEALGMDLTAKVPPVSNGGRWRHLGVAIAGVALGTGSAFAGPAGVWGVIAVGASLMGVSYAMAQAWERRRVIVRA